MKDQVLIISEILHNLLFGIIPFTRANLLKISRHKSLLRHLADRKVSLARKTRLIVGNVSAILMILQLMRKTLQNLLL